MRWENLWGYGASKSKDSELGGSKLTTFWSGANFDMFFNPYAKEEFMTGMFMGRGIRLHYPKTQQRSTFWRKQQNSKQQSLHCVWDLAHSLATTTDLSFWLKCLYMSKNHDKKIAPSKYKFQYEYIQGLLAYKYVF